MTESEWLVCTDPTPMLEFLRSRASERKLRLFACACIADYLHFVAPRPSHDASLKAALKISECYADGSVRRDEWLTKTRGPFLFSPWNSEDAHTEAIDGARLAASVAGWDGVEHFSRGQEEVHKKYQCGLLRCVRGNPFRTVTLDPAWLAWNDGTVPKMAAVLYEERAFDRLPQLADALEDAGCTDAAILDHCRGGGEHVRGCWVVDLLLGKE